MNTEVLGGDNIQVVIRVRPLNERENKTQERKCLYKESDTQITTAKECKEEKRFNYDWIIGEEGSQVDIYRKIGEPMTDACLQGYNCTIFAYGQTGAGKTYTMQGRNIESAEQDSDEFKGLQPRVLEELFNRLRNEYQHGVDYLVRCSYYEIYNEQIMDLLNPSSGNLQVREDIKAGAFIEGITEEAVLTCADAIKILIRGARNRHIGSTNMNMESSRSHSVFSMVIEQQRSREGVTNVMKSKINFVDLAGSERQKQTNAQGDRLKEATNINQSLSTLGKVIYSLVENSKGKNTHISYRDSKLTRLLKDSLGGNSKTTIIANVSPAANSYGETLSTLKFAERAKLIKNRASINEETSGSIQSLKDEINRLNQLLAEEKEKHRRESEVQKSAKKGQTVSIEQEEGFIRECNHKRAQLETMLKESLDILNETERKLHYEYDKKKEFSNLFETACSMYGNKENHMAFMLRLMKDKAQRVLNNDWSKDEEISSLNKMIEHLQGITSTTPSVMEVFQENLKLKYQIVYTNVNGDPCENIRRVMNILNHNKAFMEDLAAKIDQGIEERNKLTHRLEKLCLAKGMTSQDISMVDVSIENEQLRSTVHSLNLELIERQRLEQEAQLRMGHLLQEKQEVIQELEKERADHSAEIVNLEQRIQELNMGYLTMQQQGDAASNAFQVREIQYKDAITELRLKKDELLKKLDRTERKMTQEKEAHTCVINEYEKKVGQLNLDVMRLQEDVSMKKQAYEKIKNENIVMKKELDSLSQKVTAQKEEKSMLEESLRNLENANLAIQEESQARIKDMERHVQELDLKMEEVENQKSEMEVERIRLKEELDTFTMDLEYTKKEVDSKNKQLQQKQTEIDNLTQQNFVLTQNEKNNEMNRRLLEDELERQTQSNSPFNVAIKENHSLRTMLREKNHELDSAYKKIKIYEGSLDQLQRTMSNLNKSEAYYKAASRDLNTENQMKCLQLKELTSILDQNDKEIQDLNRSIKSLQDEIRRMQEFITKSKDILESKCSELNDTVKQLKQKERQFEDLKSRYDLKANEINLVNDKANEFQLKFFNAQQQLDCTKESSEREISHLQSLLRSINEQNKLLIQEKDEKEAELSKMKTTLSTEIVTLYDKLKKYQAIVDTLSSKEASLDKSVTNLTQEAQKIVESDQQEMTKMKKEIEDLKIDLASTKKQKITIAAKHDAMVKSFISELQQLKADKQRLDVQLKVCFQTSKLFEEELHKYKETLKLANSEKQYAAEELSNYKFELNILKDKVTQLTKKNEKLKEHNDGLKSDNDLLNRMIDDPSSRSRLKDERVAALKAKIDNLEKELTPAKSGRKSRTAKKEEAEDILEDQEEQYSAMFKNEDVKTLVKNITLKVSQYGLGNSKKIYFKSDIVSVLSNFEYIVDAYAEEYSNFRQQKLEMQSKIFRCNFLEKENEALKQQLSNKPAASNIITINQGTFGNKKPQYVSKDKAKQTNTSIDVLKEAITAFAFGQKSEGYAVPSTPTTSKQRRKTIVDENELGKRTLNFETENVLQESVRRRNKQSACMSPSSSKRNLKVCNKPIQTILDGYEGFRPNLYLDSENYDNQASTPRKKLKLD